MLRARAALLAFLALLLLPATLTGATTVAGDAGAAATSSVAEFRDPADDARFAQTRAVSQTDEQFETGETTFRIELRPGEDARWTVIRNVSLDTETREAAFETFARDYEEGRQGALLATFRRASDAASAATGREMSITNVDRDSERHNDTGQLILRFTWTNFARQSDDRLHVNDTFNTTDGTWLGGIDDTQRLVIVPPEDYTLVRASPTGYEVRTGQSLEWKGPQTFEPGTLTVVYEREESSFMLWPLLLVAALLGTGLVYALATRLTGVGLPVVLGRDGGADEGPAAATEPEPSDRGGAGATATDGEEIDTELLSDEERVERLLEQNGGRMKQANIVKETGWSNAKVSQLLSSMDEEGRIDKLRIGRENLISFPDEDVTELDGDEP